MPKGIYKHKIGRKHSEETKKKMSIIAKINGNGFWNKGRPLSEYNKINIGLANKGKKKPPFTIEHKEKLRMALIKSYATNPERKEKLRRAMIKRVLPNKNTSIELKIQDLLRENNIYFETNYPILGRPDIFIKPNICIFADGCYWHKCRECGFGENSHRDKWVTEELQKQNYIVIRIWEHEIRSNLFNKLDHITK